MFKALAVAIFTLFSITTLNAGQEQSSPSQVQDIVDAAFKHVAVANARCQTVSETAGALNRAPLESSRSVFIAKDIMANLIEANEELDRAAKLLATLVVPFTTDDSRETLVEVQMVGFLFKVSMKEETEAVECLEKIGSGLLNPIQCRILFRTAILHLSKCVEAKMNGILLAAKTMKTKYPHLVVPTLEESKT